MSIGTQTFRGKVTAETAGVRWFKKALTVTVPNSEITLISEVVAASTEVYLLGINFSCFQPGTLKVLIDSVVIGSIRVDSGNPNAEFPWLPFHTAIAGETIEVKFKALGSKPASDIEVYLQGREVPV